VLYSAAIIIAALIALFCIQNHGRGPSDSAALPLERDSLLDLLRGYVGPILLEHFHVSIRITSGTVLVDVLRTQPRPVNAWAAIEICGLESRRCRFFIGINAPFGHWQIRVRDCRKNCRPVRRRPQILLLPRKMHTCIYSKYAERNLHLLPLFERKGVENWVPSQNAVEICDFSLGHCSLYAKSPSHSSTH